MGFRQLYISKKAKIELNLNNIKVITENESVDIPISDIDLLFVENPNCQLTSNVIVECNKQNVGIILCDKKYLPSTICSSLFGSNNQIELFDKQINMLQSKKDKLWEIILKQKIINHAFVIKKVYKSSLYLDFLDYSKNIKSGDKTFLEGSEARFYFRKLFGEDFIRHQDDAINLALNYGYSILNGAIVRTLVSAGLDPKIGIHHSSKKNYFNLASDFVEPYRAFVDDYVYANKEDIIEPLSKEIRLGLINLLNKIVVINGIKTNITNSIKIFTYSFIDYMTSGNISDIKMVEFNNE